MQRGVASALFSSDQYALLDFGSGRKLERFGEIVLDRPSPAAEGFAVCDQALWRTADARYERASGERGRWHAQKVLPERWQIAHQALRFEVRPTPFGHVGVFVEQATNWSWLAEQCAPLAGTGSVLNLFAYTGGSTMAAAGAGASVVHIDSAKNVLTWARRNAEASGLAAAPVRWIAEDATKFVAREVRRGNRHDGIVLDPPSYGHGPKGELWRIEEHLPSLLADCARLRTEGRWFLLLTSHSPQHSADVLRSLVVAAFPGVQAGDCETASLTIADPFGRHLPAGNVVRVISAGPHESGGSRSP